MKIIKVLCCTLLFCFLALTKHSSYLLLIEGLTNKNVLVTQFMHSVLGQNKRLYRVMDLPT